MFFILLHLFIFGILFGLTSIRCWKLIEILKIQWTMPLISIHFTDLVVSYEPYLNVIAACWLYWITRRSLFTVLDLLYVLFFFFLERQCGWYSLWSSRLFQPVFSSLQPSFVYPYCFHQPHIFKKNKPDCETSLEAPKLNTILWNDAIQLK